MAIDVTFAAIGGLLTLIFGILVKIIGFPDQIKHNYKRKSTTGLSTTFFILSFVTYSLWTLHGILQKDSVLAIGQGLGIITTGIVLWQIYLYRNSK
ncbi:MAG TPA: SemiSWEET family transporter [archaeon]|nr:SemiSWEET family transporter [archaeon]